MEASKKRETEEALPTAPGGNVGSYRLGEHVATGGMATIHIGVGSQSSRVVALKQMLPHLADDPEYVAMFLDEARLTSLIQHPNVCAVFEHGVESGVPFMAMELLIGEDLGHFTRAIRRSGSAEELARFPAVSAKLLAEVCEGLHAAHELRDAKGDLVGVVHRDVSPHNVFVTSAGVAKIIDFGIAKARLHSHRTATGTVKGKFGYMAPEQLRGEAVDRRADVWSVGVVLFEMITGRRLFSRRTESETILAVLAADVPPLDAFVEDASPILQAIVDRALAVDKNERYANTRDMGHDLAHFAATSGSPVLVTEIADWMERLFAEDIERREILARSASRRIAELGLQGAGEGEREAGERPSEGDATRSRVVTIGPPQSKRKTLFAVVAALGIAVAGGLGIASTFGDAARPAPDSRAASEGPATETADLPDHGPATAATTDGENADENTAEPEAAGTTAASANEPQPETETGTGTESVTAPTGSVRVVGHGGVYGPEGRLGNAPGRFELPAGEHTLRLRHADGSISTTQVHVREGELTSIRFGRPASAARRPSAPGAHEERRTPRRNPRRAQGGGGAGADGLFHDLDY